MVGGPKGLIAHAWWVCMIEGLIPHFFPYRDLSRLFHSLIPDADIAEQDKSLGFVFHDI